MITQLAKMLILATFFPDNDSDLGSDILSVSNLDTDYIERSISSIYYLGIFKDNRRRNRFRRIIYRIK